MTLDIRLCQCQSRVRRPCIQNRAGDRFRAEQRSAIAAAECQVGGRHAPGASPYDLRFGAVVEQPHVTQAGVANQQIAFVVHRQAVRATGAVRGEELAYLVDAAVGHQRHAPDAVAARHRQVQHVAVWR